MFVSWICNVSVFGLGFAHDLHTLKQMSHAFIILVPSLGIVVGSRRFVCLFVFLLFVFVCL